MPRAPRKADYQLRESYNLQHAVSPERVLEALLGPEEKRTPWLPPEPLPLATQKEPARSVLPPGMPAPVAALTP